MKRIQRAFTLLELLLALTLAVIIFTAVAGMMQVYLYTLTSQQREMEQYQIARNVISMVSNDLRGALQYKPLDVTGLDDLAVSQTLVAGILSGQSDTDLIAASAQNAGGEEEEEVEEDEPTPEELEECVSCRPTMIGTEKMLVVDVSHPPRIDQYNPLVASEEEIQLPSDLKAVSYFIGKPIPGLQGNNSLFSDDAAQFGGFYRREIDRAVAAFAGEGDIIVSDADTYAELVAPEVVDVSFRYFDGSDWYLEWNSLDSDSFPVAIEIVVTLDPERLISGDPDADFAGFNPDTMYRRRSVVHLPISEPVQE